MQSGYLNHPLTVFGLFNDRPNVSRVQEQRLRARILKPNCRVQPVLCQPMYCEVRS